MSAEKFSNRYRIETHRMPFWDYSGNGVYFITLVTQHRECNLGTIYDGIMELSDFGKIVDEQWNLSFEIRHELFLNEYIIMPNHLHAIVVLDKQLSNDGLDDLRGNGGNDGMHVVETHGRASLQSTQSVQLSNQPNNPFFRKPKSISSFVAGFKSVVNSKIDDYIDSQHLKILKYNKNNHFFQPNYHDHIIRNFIEYKRIRDYIINNPANWQEDKFHL